MSKMVHITFNSKFKIKLLRSKFQYIVSGPVGDEAVREKLKIRIDFWIFDFIVLKGNASNVHEWKVNLL